MIAKRVIGSAILIRRHTHARYWAVELRPSDGGRFGAEEERLEPSC
jgi:hypothetical protein